MVCLLERGKGRQVEWSSLNWIERQARAGVRTRSRQSTGEWQFVEGSVREAQKIDVKVDIEQLEKNRQTGVLVER